MELEQLDPFRQDLAAVIIMVGGILHGCTPRKPAVVRVATSFRPGSGSGAIHAEFAYVVDAVAMYGLNTSVFLDISVVECSCVSGVDAIGYHVGSLIWEKQFVLFRLMLVVIIFFFRSLDSGYR
jgi:hypothetical protein